MNFKYGKLMTIIQLHVELTHLKKIDPLIAKLTEETFSCFWK